MKFKPSTRFRVAVGQVGLLTSLLLLAVLLGLVPDRQSEIRHGRAVLAEAIVIKATPYFTPNESQNLQSVIKVFVARNDDLLSAAVQRQDKTNLLNVGDHQENWTPMNTEYSSNTQVRVPIYSGDQRWGQLELRFKPADEFLGFNFSQAQIVPLTLFLACSSFFVFYLYLGKMLKALDPTSAIPPRVRSAFDTLAEGLMVVDLSGQIVLVNEAFANLVGEEFIDLIGRKASDFAWEAGDGSSISKRDLPWALCLETGEPQRNIEIQLLDHQKEKRTFSANCTAVMSSGTKHGGVLIGLDDVTQLEEKKKELGVAKDAAEAANQAKSDFLANMSHEIRTPMNAILGFTDVLRRGYGNQNDPKKYLNTIHSSGKHLLDLINDILDLSKVEAGKVEIENIPCQPLQIIRDVFHVLSGKAVEKSIQLDFESATPIPETIFSDPQRIRQILTNLIGNAIKFTSEGGVRVTVSLLESQPSQLQIQVRDSGIGISDTQLNNIFDPFAQADTSVTRRFGGTGLGLTISKNFAELMNGDILVESQKGEGSTFTFTTGTGDISGTPLVQPQSLDATQTELAKDSMVWQFQGQRVLVVDDGKENRELVRLLLEEVNLEVTTAENGQIGFDKAIQNPFDLIFMDMQMPVMDGYSATRLLRDNKVTTPIYALTAHAMKGFEDGCRAAGCTGYLTKPIDIDKLLDTTGRELNGIRVKSDKDIPAHLPASSDPDERKIVSSLPQGIPEFDSIIASFAIRLDEEIEKLDTAIQEGNFKQVEHIAHWLKGSGGTVGFNQFTDPAKRLEQYSKLRDTNEMLLTLDEIRDLCSRIQPDRNVPCSRSNSADTTVAAGTPLEATETQRSRMSCQEFLPDAHAQIQVMLDAWQQKDYEKLGRLADEFATETQSLGIPLLPDYSRSMANYSTEKNNQEIHAIFLNFCNWAESVETSRTQPAPAVQSLPNLAMPMTNLPNPSLQH